jgi:hypothetical protein
MLLRIDGVGTLAGRDDLILFPGIKVLEGEHIRPGDPILLKTPDGVEIATKIGALEFAKKTVGPCDFVILLRGEGIKKNAVPEGTEVWWPNAGA